jgi:Protein of unknown function (DUF3574)
MKSKTAFLAAALVAFLTAARFASADTPAPETAAMAGDAARPGSAHWLRSELYFGFGPVDGTDDGALETRWRSFLDREVTPRFPDGLTVYDAYGQWRKRGTTVPGRLRTKVLVILYEDTPSNRGAIDAIRVAYKAATHDQSVLLATERVEVSF